MDIVDACWTYCGCILDTVDAYYESLFWHRLHPIAKREKYMVSGHFEDKWIIYQTAFVPNS